MPIFFLTDQYPCISSLPFQAIQDRLGRLKSHPEEDIAKMMDASHVANDREGGRPPLSRALRLERDCLVRLGTSLGRCAEKLVCLALLDAQRMAARSPHSSGPEYANQWAYFVGALTPALDHTGMEAKVRGGGARRVLAKYKNCAHPLDPILTLFVASETSTSLQGVGCASDYDAEASMKMAQGLRREMEKMRMMMGS